MMIGKVHAASMAPFDSIHSASLSEKDMVIRSVFQAFIDLLKLIWYTINHVLKRVLEDDCCAKKTIFKDKIICPTANQAKRADLWKYIAYQRHPLDEKNIACIPPSSFGFTPQHSKIVPNLSTGHCFGNTEVFLKEWLSTLDINKVAKKFEGGSPIEGAIYQKAYLNLDSIYYPQLAKMIRHLIASYPLVNWVEEKQKWQKTLYKNALVILDAIAVYLKEGHHPKEGGFTEFIQQWCSTNHNARISGSYLATCRYVASHYENSTELRDRDLLHAAFGTAGLVVEAFYHINSTPDAILQTMTGLDSGAYEIGIPVCDSKGNLMSKHSLGLIIDADLCYILDANIAIAWCDYADLTSTMGRLLTDYIGIDYTKSLLTQCPSQSKQLTLIPSKKANLPSSSSWECSLTKVRLANCLTL